MKKSEIQEYVYEAVRDEIRKGRLIRAGEVLEELPPLMSAVCIDKESLRKALEKCMESKNPINAILMLFGLQVIKKEKTIHGVVENAEEAELIANTGDGNGYIGINSSELQKAIEAISQKLYELETEYIGEFSKERQRGDNLFDKQRKTQDELNELKIERESTERMIAEKIQYILSLKGEQSEENEQLIELLRNMNIEVFWNEEGTEFSEAAMFTHYRIDVEKPNQTPCLIRNGEIYVKGVKFISVDE